MSSEPMSGPDSVGQEAGAAQGQELNFVMKARREKLDRLRAAGVEPFGYSFDRTHTAAEAVVALGTSDEGPEVAVAGRLVSWRSQGKTAFAHLADMDGRLQLYFRKDDIGEALFAQLGEYDLGDWVGVRGPMMRTRTGEATVKVVHAELLSKSLRPLPLGKEQMVDGQLVRYSAFSDTEQRARQRYADLAVHPEVRALFRARSALTRTIRSHLDGLGYLEVETPVLQPLYGGAAFISPCPCAIAVDGVRGQARVVGGSCNLSIFFFCFGGNGRFNALRSSERGGKQLDYGGVAIDGGNRKGGEASVGQQAGIRAA